MMYSKLFLIVMAFVLIAGCTQAQNSSEYIKEKRANLSFSASGKSKFNVENINGNITVSKTSGSEIKVSYVIKAKNQETADALDRNEISVKTSETGSTLKMKTVIDDNDRTERNLNFSVDYDVALPDGVTADIETVNGNINLDGLNSGIKADLVNGNINVKNASGKVSCDLVNGNINLDVSNTSGLEAETVNGNITLNTGSGFDADLTAETLHGHIHDRGTVVKSEGFLNNKNLKTKIGSGGSKVSLSSVNGNIKIN